MDGDKPTLEQTLQSIDSTLKRIEKNLLNSTLQNFEKFAEELNNTVSDAIEKFLHMQ